MDSSNSGVIDWDWMSVAPLPAAIHHRWFIADISGWSNDGVAERENFEDDRRYFEKAIKHKEISRQLLATVSTLLCDSGSRLFFQSVFHFNGIHEKFVKIHCARTEENIEAANSHLNVVLFLYPELEETESVRRFKNMLHSDKS
ncbi:hypothetical protein BDV38DRAFT_286377 [Aspergillus pseudotamarii]|uniref:Uncharacterized protein n=1 Tax=Aspergillus pseudotamarii TaxID=132259 RepID=A0A5N6SJP0_ASPPS|nr:uncharacterized protein BDV38DRAFT_286377 [Aspergillus pseudotamarii]KAE8133901.1 hypothetical protein BDV38DRAFT_286377 [Aspergillus pseudotamarii]